MDNEGGAIGKVVATGAVRNPGPWSTSIAGETARCPAMTGYQGLPCGRRIRDVGPGITFAVRERAYQGLDKPMRGTTTQACPKCGTILECKEEQA